jgi:UDP-N-acetylglucosamine 2-epimerase (non-hydrolysing)
MKVIIVLGTRPEAIKMCPLVIEMRQHVREFDIVVCATAQHREMLDHVLSVFDVIPEYDLNLMQRDQTLFDITTNVLTEFRRVLVLEKPDLVLVQGDTTTTFAAALASFYMGVPVGHIEAGLRTGSKYSPFPEEMNRKLTSVHPETGF